MTGKRRVLVSSRELRAATPMATATEPRHLPLLRGECESDERPCPFVSCRHHLAFEPTLRGGLAVAFPELLDDEDGIRLEELPRTCSLDVADEGPRDAQAVAELLGITRERVRQIEMRALRLVAEALEQADDEHSVQ